MLRVPTTFLVFALTAIASTGCGSAQDGTPTGDASENLTSRASADLSSFEGISWVATNETLEDGDILGLRLYPDGTYVRRRCYGAGCAEDVAETDNFKAFTSRGKTYIEFWSFTRELVPSPPPRNGKSFGPEYNEVPRVADVYEIKVVGSGIKLRKTYGSRWVSLVAVDDATLCEASGGSWSPPNVTNAPSSAVDAWNACKCGTAGEFFVGGADGCMHVAVSSEAACDDTNGSYTDDEATKLGTFCRCGLGRTMTDNGCVDL